LKAVILAAGIGTRLGRRLPKSLIKLPSGKTIMSNQIHLLRKCGIKEIIVVVGFKKEFLMEEHSNVLYCYNPFYHVTNTSKSLLRAFESIADDDVIWLNGDVFLDEEVVKRMVTRDGNLIAVNNAECGEEEVKYKTDTSGVVTQISKKVENAEGEAIGINKITKHDFKKLLNGLKKCNDHDYFERGIEYAINEGVKFYPVDISDCTCVEIDFKKDLEKVLKTFEK